MIVYFSRTGNVKHICESLALPYVKGENYDCGEFILFTYTDGIGNVPKPVENFLESYSGMCKGIMVSGNSNFGSNFGKAGKILSSLYNLPLGPTFDLRGNEENLEEAKTFYERVLN